MVNRALGRVCRIPRKYLKSVALVLAFTGLLLWLQVEILLGCGWWRPLYPVDHLSLQLDPDLIYRVAPNSHPAISGEGFHQHPGNDVSGRSLWFLGDSFIMGFNVSPQETLPASLESMLADWRVLNFGVLGYGPDQSLRLLLELGQGRRPDMVLVGLFPGNDFKDLEKNHLVGDRRGQLNWRGDHRSAEELSGLQIDRLYRYLRYKQGESAHYQALFSALLGDQIDVDYIANPESPEARANRGRMRLVIAEFLRWSRDHGVPLCFVVIPSFEAIANYRIPAHGAAGNKRFLALERSMVELLEEQNARVIDLTPVFLEYPDPLMLYSPEDHHLSVEGARVAAMQLAAELGFAGGAEDHHP